jgi:hypothetical protein
MPKTLDSGASPKELAIQVGISLCLRFSRWQVLPLVTMQHLILQSPPEWLGHDRDFLVESKFSKDSGLHPRTVYRNLSPAQLYEKVGCTMIHHMYTCGLEHGAICCQICKFTAVRPRSTRNILVSCCWLWHTIYAPQLH